MLVLGKSISPLFFGCFVILFYFPTQLDQVEVSRHGMSNNLSEHEDIPNIFCLALHILLVHMHSSMEVCQNFSKVNYCDFVLFLI